MNSHAPSFRGYRFPPDIISHAIWFSYRVSLSFRDVEDLLAERGVTVTYEAIRQWCRTFGLDYARRLRHRRGRMGDTWYLDELCVKIQGRQQYLWRAVDEDGDVIDILVQSRRNRRAAIRCFRTLLKSQGYIPRRLITDKHRSYPAAHHTVIPSVVHGTDQQAHNRAEVSHQPTRQRERQMRRFKSASAARATISLGPRRRVESVPHGPSPPSGRSLPIAPDALIAGLAGGDVRLLGFGRDWPAQDEPALTSSTCLGS